MSESSSYVPRTSCHTGRSATEGTDTSAPRHFDNGAEVSLRQFGTSAEMSGHFGTGAELSETFRHRSKCKAYRNGVLGLTDS